MTQLEYRFSVTFEKDKELELTTEDYQYIEKYCLDNISREDELYMKLHEKPMCYGVIYKDNNINCYVEWGVNLEDKYGKDYIMIADINNK